MEKVRSKGLMDKYLVLKKLFDERPIYLRSAIRHLTRFLNENLKILLPAVAYYCTLGPWRTTWIRYGYNPQKDFNSRKYQTLDFRLKSNAELNSRARQRGRHIANLKPFNDEIDESSYLLKPDIIPPRKQRLYQYCDILLPEIQEMLQRLPKLPTYVKYDIKNGWFPARFIEQSREIVRNHMREQLKKRYQEERLKPTDAQTSEGDEGSLAYGSRMLSNLARARHRSVGEPGTSQVEEAIDEDAQEADVIDLIDDEDEEEEADADQERLLHGEEGDRDYDSDENSDNSSQYEIDTEALEEINKMVSGAGSIFK
ncbi:unnamed protein product [Callosobruchus maculatus]|uniref:Transcription factor IIIC subunit 5 HTH domain-containing protein n=1 Tax=Callosobruchus maculatus TaxID=64391 RepID=A0A653BRS0_CALMS|nr:unnamed protein product [Callosobruchus maculatus]